MVSTEDLVTIIKDVKQILSKDHLIEKDIVERLKKVLLQQGEMVTTRRQKESLDKNLTSLYYNLSDKALENSELIYFIVLLTVDDRLFPKLPILKKYMDCIFVSKRPMFCHEHILIVGSRPFLAMLTKK